MTAITGQRKLKPQMDVTPTSLANLKITSLANLKMFLSGGARGAHTVPVMGQIGTVTVESESDLLNKIQDVTCPVPPANPGNDLEKLLLTCTRRCGREYSKAAIFVIAPPKPGVDDPGTEKGHQWKNE